MELHGVTGAPYKHPQVRKHLPAPFSRPSINAGGQPVKRVWREVSVTEVKDLDTVANFGTVAKVVEFIDVENNSLEDTLKPSDVAPWRIRLYNVMGEYKDFSGEQRVFAFTPEAR